jgi:hypothetical protein
MHPNGCFDYQDFRNNILEIYFKDMNYYANQTINYGLYSQKISPHLAFYPQLRIVMPELGFIS